MARRRGFTLLEISVVASVVGIVAAAGIFSASRIIQEARRIDEANAAVAQIRKLRAQALVVNQSAVVETRNRPGGSGVRVTTATLAPSAASVQCGDYRNRVTNIEEHDYEMLSIDMTRPSRLLCFEPAAFRVLADDQASLAPAPVRLDLNAGDLPERPKLGELIISPLGTMSSSLDPEIQEGSSATVNVPPIPPIEDPSLSVQDPRALEPELPVTEPPPPAPTTPAGQPAVDALPPPVACPPPPPPTPQCKVAGDCGSGFDCVSGTCVPVSGFCNDDSECPDVQFGCDTATHECTKICNTFLCPATPHTCGGCQGLDCCTTYGCLCR